MGEADGRQVRVLVVKSLATVHLQACPHPHTGSGSRMSSPFRVPGALSPSLLAYCVLLAAAAHAERFRLITLIFCCSMLVYLSAYYTWREVLGDLNKGLSCFFCK